MQISELKLLNFLSGDRQFTLPIFQRRYSWTVDDCKQLLEDIIRVGANTDWSSYFLGTIVYRLESMSEITRCLLIDGQQRLTTLSLLLSALGEAIEINNVEISATREAIEQKYLLNHDQVGEDRYKLLLTKHDKDTFFQLLDEENVSETDSLLSKNYHFLKKQLKHTNLEIVYRGIHKLMIVAIELNSPSENSQVIFENLNSKGVGLTEMDLIRNYVLMNPDSDFQNRLYNNFWSPMEESFDRECPERIDDFIRHYLILKTGECPKIEEVYKSFKRFIPDLHQPEALEKKISDIVLHSQYYIDIVLLKEKEEDLRNCLKDILDLKIEGVFPLLLGVYAGYKQAQIEAKEASEIFRLIESYMFRRVICGMRTISTPTVAELAYKLEYKHGCFHILRQRVAEEHGTDRFPSDNEVKQYFPINRFSASNSKYVSYLLGKLENYKRKELGSVDISSYPNNCGNETQKSHIPRR